MDDTLSLEHCARHFLEQWYVKEKALYNGIRTDDQKARRESIGKALSIFSVARSLKRAFDVGLGQPRYQPIVVVVDRLLANASPPHPFQQHVEDIAVEIGELYGGNRPISLASKLAWLIYRDPIVIYDSFARRALQYRGSSYADYCHQWTARYKELQDQIAQTSERLATRQEYVGAAQFASSEENAAVLNSPWFHKRVFDIYLWHVGSAVA